MSQLHQQLKEKIAELEQIKRIQAHTAELQQRLHHEEDALAAMEKVLDKEQRDVETLEKEGLQTMFRKFLGDREERLDQEREEYLKASLRFNELYKSVELIKFELNLLSQKASNAEAVQGEINILMEKRAEELMQLDPVASGILKGIHDQTDKLQKFSGEISEAMKAGQLVCDFIRQAENCLNEAKNWGQQDVWDKGYGSTERKHHAVDRAQDAIFQTRHALLRFENELKDIDLELELPQLLDVEKFSRFTDVFFDNLITDWMVQNKISKSLSNVVAVRHELEFALSQLEDERKNILQKLAELENSRKATIVNKQ